MGDKKKFNPADYGATTFDPSQYGASPMQQEVMSMSPKDTAIAKLRAGIEQSQGAENRLPPISLAEIAKARNPGMSGVQDSFNELTMPTAEAMGDFGSAVAHAVRRATISGVNDPIAPISFGRDARESIGNLAGARPAESDAAAARGSQAGVVGNAIPGVITALLAARGGGKVANTIIPSTERAGVKFNQVAAKAGELPVAAGSALDSALETAAKAARGGRKPKVINDFLKRMNDDTKGPLTYNEARDFYSNASDLSASESKALNRKMKRQIVEFKQALDRSLRNTAESVGEGATYGEAMAEWRRASRLKNFGEALKKVGVGAAGATALYELHRAASK